MTLLKTLGLIGILFVSSCLYKIKSDQVKSPLTRKELRSSVGLNTFNIYSNKGHGTGFLINFEEEKYIITNAHVCNGVNYNGFVFAKKNGDIFGEILRIVKVSKEVDLCALSVGAFKFDKGLVLGSYPVEGDYVAVVGFPLDNNLTMVEGELVGDSETNLVSDSRDSESCKGRWIRANFLYELLTGYSNYCLVTYESYTTTTPIYPGNSGSALVDKYGEVVGVIFAGRSDSTVSARAVPLADLKAFLGEL